MSVDHTSGTESPEPSACDRRQRVARQLFAPFFTTKENGHGIGLTVVREILEAHGFEHRLEAVAGEPTRFTILFTPEPPRAGVP